MIEVHVVPKEYASEVWIQAEPFIAKAIARVANRVDSFAIWKCVADGVYQLWIVTNGQTIIAAFVTNIQDHPLIRAINMPYLGGEDNSIHLWYGLALQKVEEFARLNGCKIAEFTGRPGWKKLMESSGYSPIMTTFEKAL